jgi:hypothetical protein
VEEDRPWLASNFYQVVVVVQDHEVAQADHEVTREGHEDHWFCSQEVGVEN